MTISAHSPFGPEHAEMYEVMNRGKRPGKDWPGEARDVVHKIRSRLPGASSLLDVGCGTGAHLEAFRNCFVHVEGLELAPAMRERAERRLPGIPIHPGDMRNFDLGRQFDAITSLFTVIAYLGTVEEMRAAVGCMAKHLVPGGVIAVEPFWLPEQFIDGYVGSDLVRDGDRVVARVSHTERLGRAANMEAWWLVADRSGIQGFTVTEVFTLFTREEYLAAFADAGCAVEYEEGWLTGRGIFVGVKRG